MIGSEAASAAGALDGVLLEVVEVAGGLEDPGGVDDGGLELEEALVADEVLAPCVLDVAPELGAEVAVGDEAAEAAVDLVAGPVEAAALRDGGDGVVEVLGHGRSALWMLGRGLINLSRDLCCEL